MSCNVDQHCILRFFSRKVPKKAKSILKSHIHISFLNSFINKIKLHIKSLKNTCVNVYLRKKVEEEYVIVGFISDEREPWYAKKSEVEGWKKDERPKN